MSAGMDELWREVGLLREVVASLGPDEADEPESPWERLRRTHARMMGTKPERPKLTVIKGGRDA